MISLSFIAFSVACSDWDDHYEGADQAGSNLTLWQQMQQQPELSDFCQVLEQTKVFRMHRKTSVSYAQMLQSGQSFTVVAPVNGTFNRDSLLRLVQTNQGDSVVEKFFVLNHIARSATSLKDIPQTLLMLNSKHIRLADGAAQGIQLRKANIHAKNGVLHIANKTLPFTHNLYEALCDMPDLSDIGAFLRQYDEDWFDADNSVSIGLVEGVPVYIDSVVVERNRMLQNIGLINAEDSTYWMVVPTQAGWQKAWDEVSQYFAYDASVLKRDSIQQYWTNRALLDDAIFNMTDQKSTQDSLVSVPYLNWRTTWTKGKPIYHVFKQPFGASGILSGAQQVECSNGILYKVNEWPFDPVKTFFKDIWSEGESTWLITDESDCNYNERRVVGDSISDNAYLQILPVKNTSNWTLTYRINNVLAGDYDICLIVLPKTVANPNETKLFPCKFKATLNYVDENGNAQTYNFENTQFRTDPLVVDTVVMAEAFHFPACTYDQNSMKISMKLQCSILARETNMFSREMFLDCIYLRPHPRTELSDK
jgi:hypothetical protein